MNTVADMLSWNELPPEGWRLHPQMVCMIWSISGQAEMDLFALKKNSHCPMFFTKEKDALAHRWISLCLYAFPPVALLPLVMSQIREDRYSVLLIAPLWQNSLPPNPSCAASIHGLLTGAFMPFLEGHKHDLCMPKNDPFFFWPLFSPGYRPSILRDLISTLISAGAAGW